MMMMRMVHPRRGSNRRIGRCQRPPTRCHSNDRLIPSWSMNSVGVGGARGRKHGSLIPLARLMICRIHACCMEKNNSMNSINNDIKLNIIYRHRPDYIRIQ